MSLKKMLLLVPFLLFCVMHTQAQTTERQKRLVITVSQNSCSLLRAMTSIAMRCGCLVVLVLCIRTRSIGNSVMICSPNIPLSIVSPLRNLSLKVLDGQPNISTD